MRVRQNCAFVFGFGEQPLKIFLGNKGAELAPDPFVFCPAVLADDVIADPVFYMPGLCGFRMGGRALDFHQAEALDNKDLLFEIVLGHEGPGLALPVVLCFAADISRGDEF